MSFDCVPVTLARTHRFFNVPAKHYEETVLARAGRFVEALSYIEDDSGNPHRKVARFETAGQPGGSDSTNYLLTDEALWTQQETLQKRRATPNYRHNPYSRALVDFYCKEIDRALEAIGAAPTRPAQQPAFEDAQPLRAAAFG